MTGQAPRSTSHSAAPRSVQRASFAFTSTVIALAIVGGCATSGAGAATAGGADHPLIGNPAPAFDLPAQSGGKRATLPGAEGKVTLVDFWATWCGPCKASFPKYEALKQKYEGRVVFIGISEDEDADGIKGFAEETGATFPLAWDSGKGVASSYRPESMPTSFIVDKNGLVRFVHSGFRDGDEKEIASQLSSLLE
jgi:cytochrome c biogenesis protein CcmG, thiol:disulfide interchange protein DsbE